MKEYVVLRQISCGDFIAYPGDTITLDALTGKTSKDAVAVWFSVGALREVPPPEPAAS